MGILNRFRMEQPDDIESIYAVQAAAFKHTAEADLVNALRGKSECLCSVVAESNGRVVGHCLFTKVKVTSPKSKFEAAALGPVAVLPEWQGEKIGTMLIITATNVVIEKGYQILFVLGDPNYYNRFGYSDASEFGFTCSYKAPAAAFMVAGLSPNVLHGKSGLVHYAKEFDQFLPL